MALFPSLTPKNRRQRRLLFFLSIGLLLAAGVLVIELLATAWGSWGISRNALRGAMNAVGVPATFFYYIPLGVFVGLVVGLLLDSFKYIQGAVIAVATLIAIPTIFLPRGVFIEPLATSFSPNTVLTALVAAGITLWAGGVTPDSLATKPREYPKIPRIMFRLAVVLVALGLIEAHVAYQSPVLAVSDGVVLRPFVFEGLDGTDAWAHFIGAAVLLPSLRYFTTYERNLNVIMIGPKRSGKSAVFGGIHLYIRDHVDPDGQAANRVSTLRQSIENGQFPDPTSSSVQPGSRNARGSQPMLLELPYSWGRFLPTRVRFSAVDYPGEVLGEILDEVVAEARRIAQGQEAELVADGGDPSDFDVPFSDTGEDDESDGKSAAVDDDGGEWDAPFDDDPEETSESLGGDVGSPESDPTPDAGGDFGRGENGRPFGDHTDDGSRLFGGTDGGAENTGLDPKASWEQATQAVREAANQEQMIPGVRGCVHNADRIVLTLPLDDFVAPIIDRETVPDYLQDRVVTPDEIDDHRWTEIRPIEYNGRTYAIKGPDREDLENYLLWYESLQSVYPEKDIVIVGTMADWMLEDFRENHPTDDSPHADAYEDFCEHVRDEIVREQTGAINQVFGGRDADPLYLLWYEIENDEPAGTNELRIDTSGPASVLKGARQFMERINE
ncbi:hypothetical protein [Halobellus ordinarius]|uniref:hypothetical protein n=1 Tax=Halobellus ordinarius TaxID=3075120 RepID=UPI0028805D62|nr:hypothetical protein [Halobellus sp. ZY16]